MSYSRGCGFGETSCARRVSSAVVSPIAERTPTTRTPRSLAATKRRATSLILSVEPTDVPPNFMTTRSRSGAAASLVSSGTASKCVLDTLRSVGGALWRAPPVVALFLDDGGAPAACPSAAEAAPGRPEDQREHDPDRADDQQDPPDRVQGRRDEQDEAGGDQQQADTDAHVVSPPSECQR